MSGPFRRIRALRRAADDDEILADLIDFHTERAGITEQTLGECRTADGRTGYDVLVDALPPRARAVLDLGCGNGPLLARLAARDLERIVGVDACDADLRRARARLGRDPRIELRCERADAMGVARGSIDAVLSHHAFYLMRPAEAVVARVAAVLRPGGSFAFVTVSMDPSRHATYLALMQAFGPLVARDHPHFGGWGDRRMFSAEGLRGLLLDDPGGFAEMHVREDVLDIREPADVLADRLAGFFYSAYLAAEGARRELRRSWIEVLEQTRGADGLARLAFPFTLVRCETPDGTSARARARPRRRDA